MTDRMPPAPDPASAPVLRVLAGNPTAEELAVVVAVLTATGGGGAVQATTRHTSEWASPARHVRGAFAAGPRAWTHSAWPA